jgi:hypothetical protein
MPNGVEERSGRETRLLVLVVIVSIAVLLILARFRFPAADLATVTPAPNPLERLAAQAPLEDVTTAVAGVLQKITPWIVVARLDPAARAAIGEPAAETGRGAAPAGSRAGAGQAGAAGEAAALRRGMQPQWLPAVRLRADLAVLAWPPDVVLGGVLGFADVPSAVPADPVTGFAFIRLTADGMPGTVAISDASPAFTFVTVVEAGRGGVSARPVFIGRLDAVEMPPLSSFVLAVAGDPGLSPGDVLFTLEGQFIGLAVRHEDGTAIVQPRALLAAAEALVGAGDHGTS